jgi:dCMP deaminase
MATTFHETIRDVMEVFNDRFSPPGLRLDFKELFAGITVMLSYRSSCAKTKQAALLVKDNRIISFGYNGPAKGDINCLFDGGEEACGKDLSGSCYKAIHAEQNCIGYAARNGILTEGCELYVTQMPCLACAKLIVASGIVKFYYLADYRITEGVEYLKQRGIEVIKLDEEYFT